jgi:hypothetical protein
LIEGVRDEQWSAPTPFRDWTVHDLVNHLVGMNLVFVALLTDEDPPARRADRLGDDPAGAYRDAGSVLITAFDRPGVLEHTFHGPLGAATGQPVELPNDSAEKALAFARVQLSTQARTGRFEPAQPIAEDAPAIDRLVAFLGRPVSTPS